MIKLSSILLQVLFQVMGTYFIVTCGTVKDVSDKQNVQNYTINDNPKLNTTLRSKDDLLYKDLIRNGEDKNSTLNERSFVFIHQRFKKPVTLLAALQVPNVDMTHKFHLLDVDSGANDEIQGKYGEEVVDKAAHDENVDFFISDKLLNNQTILEDRWKTNQMLNTKNQHNTEMNFDRLPVGSANFLELLKKPLLRSNKKEFDQFKSVGAGSNGLLIQKPYLSSQYNLEQYNNNIDTIKTYNNPYFNDSNRIDNSYETISEQAVNMKTKESDTRVKEFNNMNNRKHNFRLKDKQRFLSSVDVKCECDNKQVDKAKKQMLPNM